MAYRLVFDIGSKTTKCAVGNENDELVAIESIHPAVITSKDGFARSYDAETFWGNILALAKLTIEKSGIAPDLIKYITCSSIRPSCVFADKNDDPIYVGSSFDIRGINSADSIEPKFEKLSGKSFFQATGHFPALMYPPARFGWFRENEPDACSRIAKYLPVDSWVLAKLGAEEHANIASAAESGFYDITIKDWNYEWMSILDLPDDFFPPVVQSGEIVGDVSSGASKSLGLSRDAEIVSGLPDTQAALIGAGCVGDLDAGIVVGSTTPVQVLKKDLYLDPQARTWTTMMNLKNVVDSYVIEASTGITGQILAWLGGLLYTDDGQFDPNLYPRIDADYDALDAEEAANPESSQDVFAFLGPEHLASSQNAIVPGVFLFPTPGTVDEARLSRRQLVGSMFENFSFALYKNLRFLQGLIAQALNGSYLLGGVTYSSTFCQRFADLAIATIKTTVDKEPTIKGLLFACSVAAGDVKGTSDLVERIETQNGIVQFTPRGNMTNILQKRFEKWDRIRENVKML